MCLHFLKILKPVTARALAAAAQAVAARLRQLCRWTSGHAALARSSTVSPVTVAAFVKRLGFLKAREGLLLAPTEATARKCEGCAPARFSQTLRALSRAFQVAPSTVLRSFTAALPTLQQEQELQQQLQPQCGPSEWEIACAC